MNREDPNFRDSLNNGLLYLKAKGHKAQGILMQVYLGKFQVYLKGLSLPAQSWSRAWITEFHNWGYKSAL